MDNREKLNENKRLWAKGNPRNYHVGQLKAKYGITGAEWDAMFKAQDGTCKICKQTETNIGKHGRIKMLSVDHCHKTGKVRGLLCSNCNQSLGKIKENFDTCLAMAKYIQDHNNVL